MAVWNRTSKPSADDSDNVSLDDADHAWWAGRDELKKAWAPPERKADSTPKARPSPFGDKYPTSSLFNWADGPEPDDPTMGGTGSLLDPYAVLALQPGASIDEVVAAHRRLAKTYHPDRQHAASEPEREAAEQTMRLVNAAYQELRSRLET